MALCMNTLHSCSVVDISLLASSMRRRRTSVQGKLCHGYCCMGSQIKVLCNITQRTCTWIVSLHISLGFDSGVFMLDIELTLYSKIQQCSCQHYPTTPKEHVGSLCFHFAFLAIFCCIRHSGIVMKAKHRLPNSLSVCIVIVYYITM